MSPCTVPLFQVNEIVPEEKCDFRPHRVCHTVRRRRKRNRRFRGRRTTGRASRSSAVAAEYLGLGRRQRMRDWDDWDRDQQRQQTQRWSTGQNS